MTNNYDILGIPRNSSKDEAKKAFRRLAHIHHPDKGGSEAKFKEINNAYNSIMKEPASNPFQSREYGTGSSFHDTIFKWKMYADDRNYGSGFDPFTSFTSRMRREEEERRKSRDQQMRDSVRSILGRMNGVQKKVDSDGRIWYSF